MAHLIDNARLVRELTAALRDIERVIEMFEDYDRSDIAALVIDLRYRRDRIEATLRDVRQAARLSVVA